MIIALGVLFVTSLVLAAVFVAANGDIGLTRTDTNQKKAYYAALAGISAYKYHLNTEPDYWKKCPSIPSSGENVSIPGTTDEKYAVKTLHSTEHTEAECKSAKQSAILQTTGSAVGTFRIESVGTVVEGSKTTTRTLVATFTHPGFINYVYLTNYEILDPSAQNPEPTECEHYYAYRVEHGLTKTCGTIQFAPNDKINGPMHTNDAAAICAEGSSKPTFGRNSEDKIEMNGGHYAAGGCSNSPEILGTYTEKGPTLIPPESDSELIEAAEYKFKGKTFIELKTGVPNTISVTSGGKTEIKNFPPNGLIYVENSGSCPIKYTPFGTNYTGDENCGNAYVKGAYTESLTIASANDLIVNGNLTTTTEASGKPKGSAVLGLIATNFVRVYHPVEKEYEVNTQKPATEPPWTGTEICGTPPSRTGTLKSGKSEVTVVTPTTAGLTAGEAISGTGIPAGTTIKEVKSSTVIVLSQNATASGAQTLIFSRTGALKSGKSEVTVVTPTTAGLTAGEAVSGTGIPAGTTIKEVKSSTVIVLSKNATASGAQTLTFYKLTGFEYHSGQALCVEKGKSGYVYHESETLYAEECNSSKDTYTNNGHCVYENASSGCDAENATGSFEPTIDAAILSTSHSFIVDNFKCGEHLGNLNIWGSIAQFWRGAVGSGEHGYTKNYNYDDRLQTIQPPDFLTPTSSSLKLSRVTAVKNGYTG
jgi:hypothetical protein